MATTPQPEQQMTVRPPMNHRCKSWPSVFRDVKAGIKGSEFRLNDRDYRVGDTITHCEWDPETQEFTGGELTTPITHAVYGPAFGIPEGYVMMTTPPQVAVDALTVLGDERLRNLTRRLHLSGEVAGYDLSMELTPGKWTSFAVSTPIDATSAAANAIRTQEVPTK